MTHIIFQLSCKLYSGFQYKIDTYTLNFMTNDDIIDDIKTKLKNVFNTHNLEILKDGINSLNLHIHDEFRNTSTSNIVYVCDHEH